METSLQIEMDAACHALLQDLLGAYPKPEPGAPTIKLFNNFALVDETVVIRSGDIPEHFARQFVFPNRTCTPGVTYMLLDKSALSNQLPILRARDRAWMVYSRYCMDNDLDYLHSTVVPRILEMQCRKTPVSGNYFLMFNDCSVWSVKGGGPPTLVSPEILGLGCPRFDYDKLPHVVCIDRMIASSYAFLETLEQCLAIRSMVKHLRVVDVQVEVEDGSVFL